MPNAVNGVELPNDFPAASYEAVHESLRWMDPPLPGFAPAWNGTAYRFDALARYASKLEKAFEKTAPSHSDRVDEERWLFGLFTNAQSSIETTFFAIFSIGRHFEPGKFAGKNEREITPEATKRALALCEGDAAAVLHRACDEVLSSPLWGELRDARNVLSHRSAPSRTVLCGPEEQPTQWSHRELSLLPEMPISIRSGVASALTKIIDATAPFVAGLSKNVP